MKRAPILARRALNRALLARQMLIERADISIPRAVEHLVGLQAQATLPPYYGLWSRLTSFDPDQLGRMISAGELVRLTLMRGTIHLVTVDDAFSLRSLLHEMLLRRAGTARRKMGEEAFARLTPAVRAMLATESLGAKEIAQRLVEQGIGTDPVGIGYVVSAIVPLVQLPPRGIWSAGGQVRYATLESWTGRELDAEPSIERLVLRYLGAFGPASVMDMQNWSGLSRLKPIFEGLRSRLVTVVSEEGTELFDLPDAPRPDPETPAPVRFLGEYDNVLLGHKDRRRIIPSDFPWPAMLAGERFVNNLLVDGMVRATWWIEWEGKRRATLCIRPFPKLLGSEKAAVTEEAWRMIAFAAPGAEAREVRFVPLGAGSRAP